MYCNPNPFSLFESDAEINSSRDMLISITGNEAYFTDVNYAGNSAILPIFNKLTDELVIDRYWAINLRKYVYGFITRKVNMIDYQAFFGSPYLGLEKIVFSSADRNRWFSEVIDLDEEELVYHLHNTAFIKKEWGVVGDAFNMTIPYLLYRVLNSKLDRLSKEQAAKDIVCMYHYKCLTSIVNNDYPFIARREVVIETYNRLSLKYDIKRYGSWKALIEARADFILNPRTGIHYKAFSEMKDDKAIVYFVGDTQNRLRRVINEINKVFHQVKTETDIISLDKSKVNLGEVLTIKSINTEISDSRIYIEGVVTEGTSFYREEFIDYAMDSLEGCPRDKLKYVITNFSSYYSNPRNKHFKTFIENVLVNLFEYIQTQNIEKTNIYEILVRMRGSLNSPRNKNVTTLALRKDGDRVVREITGIKTTYTVSSIRTALILYTMLLILTREHNK